MSLPDSPGEPPLYRPFALLAFAATLLGGTPLGIWMLAWLYLGAPAVPIEWILLHAHLQIFGFFATLIPGVAPHLFARFTGRRLERQRVTRWLVGLLAGALLFRIAGTWSGSPAPILLGSLQQTAAFLVFGVWVWSSLDPPPLGPLRRHLTISSAWLGVACLVESAFRWRALATGLQVPDPAGLRVVHVAALFGGVLGWMLGVLLRAGPMFIPDFRVPHATVRAIPWLLALAVWTAAMGELGGFRPSTATALARLGDTIALAGAASVLLTGGALRRSRKALPMLSRSPQEARIFRLAITSAIFGAVGFAGLAAAPGTEAATHQLTDALRHLVTVGFLTAVVVAMAFRLIPVLESAPLPWPRLRSVAFWALAGSVLLRTAEVLAGLGWRGISSLVIVSGLLAWIAIACVGLNTVGAMAQTRHR